MMSKQDSDILMMQLRQHCRDNGIFQGAIADEMQRSQSQVSSWLSCGSSPTLTNATSMARAAGKMLVLVDDPTSPASLDAAAKALVQAQQAEDETAANDL